MDHSVDTPRDGRAGRAPTHHQRAVATAAAAAIAALIGLYVLAGLAPELDLGSGMGDCLPSHVACAPPPAAATPVKAAAADVPRPTLPQRRGPPPAQPAGAGVPDR